MDICTRPHMAVSYTHLDVYKRQGTIVRGGSTITEQYIKNLYFPHAPRTIYQKIIESYYAIVLELEYTKEEILRKYLDSVYMGNGLYGIETAHIHYF